jgi:hypothetical protein
MKALLLSLLLCTGASAAQGDFLNVALLSLPEKYLAGISLENRATLLLKVSGSVGYNPKFDDRLDYPNGYFEYYNDAPHHSVGATTRFWVKLLYREQANPLVFVRMAGNRSMEDANPEERPAKAMGASYLLEWRGGKWLDVTDAYIPKEAAQGSSLVPMREGQAIRVATMTKKPTRDGNGFYWAEEDAKKELHWTGSRFEVTPLEADEANSENREAEQGGTGQPATRPESKSEGGDKPQPESEGRSR